MSKSRKYLNDIHELLGQTEGQEEEERVPGDNFPDNIQRQPRQLLKIKALQIYQPNSAKNTRNENKKHRNSIETNCLQQNLPTFPRKQLQFRICIPYRSEGRKGTGKSPRSPRRGRKGRSDCR